MTVYDAYDNVTADNVTEVTLTAGSCGGTAIGSGTLSAGTVAFATTQHFKTAATGVSLSAAAAAAPPTSASATFNVVANPDAVFWSDFESRTP